jgi:ribosome-binding factor A
MAGYGKRTTALTESSRRSKRVAQVVRDQVARFLVTQAADARLAKVVITDARITDDLSVVHLGFRVLSGSFTPEDQSRILKQLEMITGRLRKIIGPELQLRRVPEIRFVPDKGYDAQKRVEELLEEIRTGNK